MTCAECHHWYPDELGLVKGVQFLGRWRVLCAICAVDHGEVRGINYGRAVRYLEAERRAIQRAVMQSVAVDPDPEHRDLVAKLTVITTPGPEVELD